MGVYVLIRHTSYPFIDPRPFFIHRFRFFNVIYRILYDPDTRLISIDRNAMTKGDRNYVHLDFIIDRYQQLVGDWANQQGYTAYCVFDKDHIIPLPLTPAPSLPTDVILHINGWDNQYYMIPYKNGEGWWIYNSRNNYCFSPWVQSFEEACYQIESYEGESLFPPEVYEDYAMPYPEIPDNPDWEYQPGDYPFEREEDTKEGGINVPTDLLKKPYLNVQLKFINDSNRYYSINILEMQLNKFIA